VHVTTQHAGRGVRGYYEDFALTGEDDGWMSTADGGKRLRLVRASRQRLPGIEIGVDDRDEIGRIVGQLRRTGIAVPPHLRRRG
jgi:hypothetical protein